MDEKQMQELLTLLRRMDSKLDLLIRMESELKSANSSLGKIIERLGGESASPTATL